MNFNVGFVYIHGFTGLTRIPSRNTGCYDPYTIKHIPKHIPTVHTEDVTNVVSITGITLKFVDDVQPTFQK